MNIVNYVKHNKEGVITSYGTCPEIMVDIQAQEGEFVLIGKGTDISHYVDMVTNEIKVKPESKITINKQVVKADGQDQLEITNITAPASVIIVDPINTCEQHQVLDTSLTMTFDHPGKYKITVEHIQHLPFTVEVTVVM